MIKTLVKYLFNRKAILEPKKINKETIKYFIQGHIRDFAKNFGLVDEYILEQASWREQQVKEKSPECFDTGKCKYCECSLKETVISDTSCEHGCFPKMLSKREWEKAKQINHINFNTNVDNTDHH